MKREGRGGVVIRGTRVARVYTQNWEMERKGGGKKKRCLTSLPESLKRLGKRLTL